MKPGNDANESRAEGTPKPYAILGAGRLTASIWKEGDEGAGWQYRFNLFRMSRTSGRVGQRFLPQDVPHLARMAQLLAFALADDGCIDRSLRDELSCLASFLDERLPSNRGGGRPRLSVVVRHALREVLNYLLDDEKEHFARSPSPGHIYRRLVLLHQWAAGVEEVESLRLDCIDAEGISDSRGGCPLCAAIDDIVSVAGIRWAVCRRHRTRWCLGSSAEANGCAAQEEAAAGIHDYLIVEPLRRMDARTPRKR